MAVAHHVQCDSIELERFSMTHRKSFESPRCEFQRNLYYPSKTSEMEGGEHAKNFSEFQIFPSRTKKGLVDVCLSIKPTWLNYRRANHNINGTHPSRKRNERPSMKEVGDKRVVSFSLGPLTEVVRTWGRLWSKWTRRLS